MRLRLPWLIVSALALQFLIISVVPGGLPLVHKVAHLASYAMAAAFVFVNRSVPGMWLLALGGALNVTAIAANGGVMPARPAALAAAGIARQADHFRNSTALAAPKLAFLGDVFALPEPWPLHNVFSVGDVVLVVGAAVALHGICGSKLARRRSEAAASSRHLVKTGAPRGRSRCRRRHENAGARPRHVGTWTPCPAPRPPPS